MNISEVIPRTSHGQGLQAKRLQGGDCDVPASEAQGDVNDGFRGEKEWANGPEVISLDFADGVWQKVGSTGHDTYRGFSHFSGGNKRQRLWGGFEKDKIYYDREGMLVIREELKGRFVDGIF